MTGSLLPAKWLHDVFAVPFEEIAGVVGRTPTAARQLASRADIAWKMFHQSCSICYSSKKWPPHLWL